MASSLHISPPNQPTLLSKSHITNSLNANTKPSNFPSKDSSFPTMPEIMESSRAQNLKLRLQNFGPFFRVKAVSSLDERVELGRAEGVIRPWLDGMILHLDSMKMTRATLGMERSIFGLGLFVGAAAVRYGYDCGCRRAELLAIDDSNLYHSKLVKFYTRMGFEVVREVDGSSLRDLSHTLVWGGKGTRMDADIEKLMLKWGRRFKPPEGRV